MRIDIITLFPKFFAPIFEGSIIGRAQNRGLARIAVHDLRDFIPAGRRADDAPYGGGSGMVLRLEPVVGALEMLLGPDLALPPGCKIIVPSPAGRPFDHASACRLASHAWLIVVCGHYEGIDERLFKLVAATELSLGDFVLTGGEIPALAFVDACVRMLPEAIAAQSAENDSFSAGALDWPHYTRPSEFRGLRVPDILLSGDHTRIDRWRRRQARMRTARRRPDLLADQVARESK
ncbi:MAG: tRNA (guanosine(37)-N1)-methyltransferase TrmD [Candidatus Eremiobacteraeota bacterium]|nr:tRNA (guanosine(37)-N1)-methyltransferase TrmD [Candidatus Eremiobacteraeota bacterium]MBC5828114.1 tRNA (guanosine(37)-N1)-methyltransferase TrmD [Candidatus Eremiobacteraeota bacterium]